MNSWELGASLFSVANSNIWLCYFSIWGLTFLIFTIGMIRQSAIQRVIQLEAQASLILELRSSPHIPKFLLETKPHFPLIPRP